MIIGWYVVRQSSRLAAQQICDAKDGCSWCPWMTRRSGKMSMSSENDKKSYFRLSHSRHWNAIREREQETYFDCTI